MNAPPIRRLWPAALALPLLLVATAHAGDDESMTPAQRLEAEAMSLPAPAAANALDFAGELLVDGKPLGSVGLQGKPGTEGGSPTWDVVEFVQMGKGAYERRSHVTLDAQLRPVEGTMEAVDPGKPRQKITWKRTGTTFEIHRTWKENGQEMSETKTVSPTGRTMATMTSLVLFGRMHAADSGGPYEALVFDPDPGEGEEALVKSTWTLESGATWHGKPARKIDGHKGDRHVELYFDPDSRDFLGGRLSDPTHPAVEMAPKAAESPASQEESDELFQSPASSAKAAAFQAALAFAAADMDLLERVIHWPTVYAQLKAKYEKQGNTKPYPPMETIKALILKQLSGRLKKNPESMVRLGLSAVEDDVHVVEEGPGRARVEFPAAFKNLKLEVGEFDGKWYLVELPGG